MDQANNIIGNLPSFISEDGEILYPDLRDLGKEKMRLYTKDKKFWGFSNDSRLVLKECKDYPEGEE